MDKRQADLVAYAEREAVDGLRRLELGEFGFAAFAFLRAYRFAQEAYEVGGNRLPGAPRLGETDDAGYPS